MLQFIAQNKDAVLAFTSLITSIVCIIALFVTAKYAGRQFRHQQMKVLIDTLNAEDSKTLDQFLNALVAVLIGSQRVLITYANDNDLGKLRNLIHEANIWPIKLQIFLLSNPTKTNISDPLMQLSKMVLKRKDESWKSSEFDQDEFDRLFLAIQLDGAAIVSEYRDRIEARLKQLENLR